MLYENRNGVVVPTGDNNDPEIEAVCQSLLLKKRAAAPMLGKIFRG